MTSRLTYAAPELVPVLEGLDEEGSARLAAALVEWALAGSAMQDDPRIAGVVQGVREGRVASAAVRVVVADLVQELDEAAWDIQDELKPGEPEDEYVRAFRRARAVNALSYALDVSAADALLECAYEAHAATGDTEGLRRVVRDSLR